MNKTLTINLAGMVFNIEEDAYQSLQAYLLAIKNHFKNEEGSEEIVSDIEARMAELLKARTSDSKQVLVQADIDEAVSIMGRPEDFAGESTNEKTASDSHRSYYYGPRKRRIFRDAEHKVFGGVCSGISEHFDVDPIGIRLAFVALIFLGFGSGILIYIILWIIIPEAKTTAQKLEMRGEPIDINTISKTIKDEAEQFKSRMQNFGEGVKREYYYQRDNGNRFVGFFHRLFHGILNVIAKIAGGFFVLIGVMVFTVLLVALMGVGKIDGLKVNQFFEVIGNDDFSLLLAKFGLLLFVGIPFAMLIYKGMKLLLGIRVRYKWLNLSAGILWTIGFIIFMFQFAALMNNFSEKTEMKEEVKIATAPADTLYIKARANYNKEPNDSRFEVFDVDYLVNNEVKPMSWHGKPKVRIITSENDSLYVFIIRSSHGINKSEAGRRAQKINYSATAQDSVLLLENYFSFTVDEKLRVQDVEVLVKLPKNKAVYLDDNLERLLYDVENTNNIIDDEMAGKYWLMTPNGLKCLSCTAEDLERSKTINIHDSDAHVRIDKDGIEVKAKEAHVKISSDGIKIDEQKRH